MSNYASLERYIPLVKFMGEICGKNYEIILHDVSTPERSVIAACNEHLSGRRVGDPMTELAKELLRTGAYKEHDYVANYEGRTRGGKRFVSSTYFIKEKGQLVGLICVNHDVEDIWCSRSISPTCSIPFSSARGGELRLYRRPGRFHPGAVQQSDPLHHPRLWYSLQCHAYRRQAGDTPLSGSAGVFQTKGSVGQVAGELHISEPTVYRYLRRIRSETS